MSKTNFRIGGTYRNDRGSYEVLGIDGEIMKVRYQDGRLGYLSVQVQTKIANVDVSIKRPFEVGKVYSNEKGEFRVLSIDGDIMKVRFQDGRRGYLSAVRWQPTPYRPTTVPGAHYRTIKRESQLQERLSLDLGALFEFGFDLELYVDQSSGTSGKEFRCNNNGGRIDLLCVDRVKGSFVVIELKNVLATEATYGQISRYMGWVNKHLSPKPDTAGIVISRGADPHFMLALEAGADISWIDLKDIGFQ